MKFKEYSKIVFLFLVFLLLFSIVNINYAEEVVEIEKEVQSGPINEEYFITREEYIKSLKERESEGSVTSGKGYYASNFTPVKGTDDLPLRDYIVQELRKGTTKINIEKYKIQQLDYFAIVNEIFDYPEAFNVSSILNWFVPLNFNNEAVYIQVSYYNTPQETIDGYWNTIDKTVEEFLAGVKPEWCDLEKAIYTHDFIVRRTSYSTEISTYKYTMVGPLVLNDAVCQGYSLAYKYLASKIGLEAELVTSRSLNHAWNIVKIGNYWYHIDSTWNDPSNYTGYGIAFYDQAIKSDENFMRRDHNANDWTTKYTADSTALDDTVINNEIYSDRIQTFLHYGEDGYWYFIKNYNKVYKVSLKNNTVGEAILVKTLSKYASWGCGLTTDGEYYYTNDNYNIYKLDSNFNIIETYFSLEDHTYPIYGIDFKDYKMYYNTIDGNAYEFTLHEYSPLFKIEFEQDEYEVEKESSLDLVVKYFPEDTIDSKTLTWQSSNSSIISVDNNGRVTGVGYGTVTITATSQNGKVATCSVKVTHTHYTVTFDTKGGTPIDPIIVEDGKKISRPANPTFDNNNFSGWFTDENYTNEFDFNLPITKNITLYAKWISVVWIYTYDRTTSIYYNGGYLYLNDDVGNNVRRMIDDVPGTVYTLHAVPKKGYRFVGWYEKSTNGTLLSEELSYDYTITGGSSVYAIFEENHHTVEFNTNGGSEIEAVDVLDGYTVNRPEDPTKDNLNFVNWYKDSRLTTLFDFSQEIHADTTIYAKWEAKIDVKVYEKYTNTFYKGGTIKLNSGEAIKDNIIYKDVPNRRFSLTATPDNGYAFIGWYEDGPNGTLLSTDSQYFSTVIRNMNIVAVFREKTKPNVKYRIQVINEGWHEWLGEGNIAMRNVDGRLQQAMEIKLEDNYYKGDIVYSVHVENVGWMDEVKNGATAGIPGTKLRTEALKISLTGELKDNFDIYYRTHVQNLGWMSWAKNGESSGSSGAGWRIEGLEIKLVKKGEAEPSYSVYESDKSYPFHEVVNVMYSAHIENRGDVGTNNKIRNGITLGEPGKHLRMEGITIKSESTTAGSIEYTTHVQNVGWLEEVDGRWSKSGEFSGRKGLGFRLEAIRIKLTGELAEKYSVYYRVYSEKDGKWLDWAKDGMPAGSVGFASKLEAIQIKILVHNDPNEPEVGPNALMTNE